jgi:sigma-B regulation protein RsbU (phosphoserine phosphatase)
MISRIMVVDDEPDLEVLITQKYRRKIRNNELEFVFARNGIDALNKLQGNGDIDIVLTDINMPEMDGLTLLANIHEKYPLLKSVIVSAYGDMANIRVAFNRGAFDFLTKPIDFQDLEITIDKTLHEAKLLKQAENDRTRLAALQNELDIAREIQAAMIPQNFPPFPKRNEFEIYAHMIPAKKVGGDFYDFFFIDDDHLGFMIGDVSGKGVPAALFMAVSRTLLKSTALRGTSPAECLSRVNKLLRAEKTNGMFVTVFYGILNTKTGEIDYSNGGHNPPMIIRHDEKIKQSDLTENFVVGAISSSEYNSKKLNLLDGDCLLLHTDGVTEAMNTKNEQYSEERLVQCLEKNKQLDVTKLVQQLSDDVKDFSTGAEQSDDITIMALKYLG